MEPNKWLHLQIRDQSLLPDLRAKFSLGELALHRCITNRSIWRANLLIMLSCWLMQYSLSLWKKIHCEINKAHPRVLFLYFKIIFFSFILIFFMVRMFLKINIKNKIYKIIKILLLCIFKKTFKNNWNSWKKNRVKSGLNFWYDNWRDKPRKQRRSMIGTGGTRGRSG